MDKNLKNFIYEIGDKLRAYNVHKEFNEDFNQEIIDEHSKRLIDHIRIDYEENKEAENIYNKLIEFQEGDSARDIIDLIENL